MTLRLREGVKLDNDKIVTMLNHLSISLEILLDRPTQRKEVATMQYNDADVQRLVNYTRTCAAHNWNQDALDYMDSILAPFQPDPDVELSIKLDALVTEQLRQATGLRLARDLSTAHKNAIPHIVSGMVYALKKEGWTPPKR